MVITEDFIQTIYSTSDETNYHFDCTIAIDN